MAELDINEFLNHKSSDRGAFLKNWKEKKKLNVFLHTRVLPLPIWQHGLPKVVVLDDEDGESTRKVWTGKHVCHETEDVLKRQFKRDEDGDRIAPPKRCGICRTAEHVRGMVRRGEVGMCDPLFRFEASAPEDTVVLRAAGFYNGYPRSMKEASKAEAEAIRAAGVSLKEAWKENALAKLAYIFAVVVADDPGSGVQISVETGLLGDRVKDVIANMMESKGSEAGNILTHPYCIQWEYREDAKKFDEKYDARPIERVEPTPEILELIRGPRPDFGGADKKFKSAVVRTMLEDACVKPKLFDWDELFGRGGDEEAEPEAPRGGGRTPEVASSAPAEEDEEVACDQCEAPMKLSDPKCPHCGHVYDAEKRAAQEAAAKAKAEPPSPPKGMRKRGAKKDVAPAKPAPAPEPGASDAPEDDDSDVPF